LISQRLPVGGSRVMAIMWCSWRGTAEWIKKTLQHLDIGADGISAGSSSPLLSTLQTNKPLLMFCDISYFITAVTEMSHAGSREKTDLQNTPDPFAGWDFIWNKTAPLAQKTTLTEDHPWRFCISQMYLMSVTDMNITSYLGRQIRQWHHSSTIRL